MHTGGVLLAVPSAGVPLVGMSGIDYVYIPVISAVVVALLGLLLRWSRQPVTARAGSRVADKTQGLLIGLVSAHPEEAERVCDLLTSAGVRTTSRPVASRRQVLVWPDDLDTALRLIHDDRAGR